MKKNKGFLIFFLIAASLFLCALLPDCTDPKAVCVTTIDIAAKAIVRCDPDTNLAETKKQLLKAWALGNCGTIKKIRDIAGLYECLDWLKEVDCEVINSGQKPPTCENQLLMSIDEF